MNRFFFITFFLLLHTWDMNAQKTEKEPSSSMDLFLCIGQSNMAGRASLSPELMDTLQNVYLLNDSGYFEPAVNPLNRYSTIRKTLSMQRLGPSYSFAKEMARKTSHRIGLVVNARGESSIKAWLKGSPEGYYEEALKRIRTAMQQGGRLRAILWHQGEADSKFPESYRTRLISLVQSFREDLGMPDLPFIFGEISQWGEWTKREQGTKEFNKMLKEMARSIPHSACVSSKGADMYKNEFDPHFGTQGQLLIGKRYAREVLKQVAM
ncbi:sialate O-acetylesterase [uncultured Bacteroides sp.]|uniref:sialate O-acetylesterase n=1 Tax=uncultured Bacteroides sp. TaxID=162156 RepID=UPI0025D24ADC|nr:sialate O-acetylesterase [uncultured Bacteroides sp.]